MFSLQEKSNALTQTPEMGIFEFFTKINTLWDEFDELNHVPTCSCPVVASCTCEVAKKCFKMQQNLKVISFLMKPQAYRILLQEETHLQLSSSEKDLNES